MTWNELTGLDEEFMREHRIENPPSWLLPFIQNGMVLRAAIGHVATPKPLQGRQTLRFTLRTRNANGSVYVTACASAATDFFVFSFAIQSD